MHTKLPGRSASRPDVPRRPRTSRDVPAALLTPRILAFAGQKGGAGKTTTAIATACEWQARGRRVLLVDTDPQGSTRTWADVAGGG
jgi:Mrp family chromosome partitioning ATPase